MERLEAVQRGGRERGRGTGREGAGGSGTQGHMDLDFVQCRDLQVRAAGAARGGFCALLRDAGRAPAAESGYVFEPLEGVHGAGRSREREARA